MEQVDPVWGNVLQFRFLNIGNTQHFLCSWTLCLSQEPSYWKQVKHKQEFGSYNKYISNLPEYHRSVSYESSRLLSLLANSPSSSSLHTYLLCSSPRQLDRGSQEHLHNRMDFIMNFWKRKSMKVCVNVSLVYGQKLMAKILNSTHRLTSHCSRSTGRCSTLLFGRLSHSLLHLVDGWPLGSTFQITGSACCFLI